ncbi:MAG: 3-deoxy-D-manno-octulosonic acid kinase [Woeseiaceae bacterium]|nr:3-deoxy-D-manno-octulosonic acid kinase [Woeseiaceae bacterium]
MTETVKRTKDGAILYDKGIINQISPERFTAGGWEHAEVLTGALRSGGRGNTMFVGNTPRQFVLRHYRRGGLLGKIVKDSYIFTGEDLTRSFMEWRLLEVLAMKNMNVPRPAAARFCRSGVFYTADLITVCIPDVISLSQYIAIKDCDDAFWWSVGRSIWKFHEAGVYHSDMNAYNVQVDKDGDIWMLDFDKSSLKSPGSWQQETLNRLHRSLLKIFELNPKINFHTANWNELLKGYLDASKSA